MPDPKKSSLVIDMGPMGPPPGDEHGAPPPPSEGMPADDKSYDEEADGFAQDAFEAVKAGNAEAFKSAIRGLVESCM